MFLMMVLIIFTSYSLLMNQEAQPCNSCSTRFKGLEKGTDEVKRVWSREGDEIQHTVTFLHLMEVSDEFTRLEKKKLMEFAQEGNVIYQASFRVA